MARPLRIEFPGALYHVTARGNARQDIFLDDEDRNRFLSVLEQVVPRFHLGYTAASDIDLIVMSDSLTYTDVFAALEPVSVELGRPVNPTVHSRRELTRRIKDGNAFVDGVRSCSVHLRLLTYRQGQTPPRRVPRPAVPRHRPRQRPPGHLPG
jgi:hypothetical protein